MWPCIFELALSMILTGCKTSIHFQTKLTVATPQATRLYHSVHMFTPLWFAPVIIGTDLNPKKETLPGWWMQTNCGKWRYVIWKSVPSSNFKPKHPIIGLPLGRRGGCKRRANRLAYRGPFVYASVKVARFPQMWTWAFCKPGPRRSRCSAANLNTTRGCGRLYSNLLYSPILFFLCVCVCVFVVRPPPHYTPPWWWVVGMFVVGDKYELCVDTRRKSASKAVQHRNINL